jgi:hypothetical protein
MPVQPQKDGTCKRMVPGKYGIAPDACGRIAKLVDRKPEFIFTVPQMQKQEAGRYFPGERGTKFKSNALRVIIIRCTEKIVIVINPERSLVLRLGIGIGNKNAAGKKKNKKSSHVMIYEKKYKKDLSREIRP